MAPLIEIKNVPIEIEMKISHAKLEYTRGSADLEISHNQKGMHIKSKPIHVNVDTYQSSNAIVPTTMHSIEQDIDCGKKGTYEATASFAQEAQQLLIKAKVDNEALNQLNIGINPTNYSGVLNRQVGEQDQIESSPDLSEMNIRFEMDKLNFDWRINSQEFEFTPGAIEFSIAQRPDVIITYVGGPIYVPPSSDPDYEPVDVQA